MLRPEAGLCPCCAIGRRRKVSFVDKTIAGASNLMRRTLFTDDIAARPGLMQRLDPRVKVSSVLALVITVAIVRNIPVLVALYAVALLLAVASLIPATYFIKRVWLFVPLFTGIVVLPATLSFITPGDIVVSLGTWFGHPLGLTSQGLRSAGLVVLRVATSISFVLLIASTTTWTRLLAALRVMLVPRMFVMVLGMANRYVFHLLNSVAEMYEARKARTVSAANDVRSGRAFVSATAGSVFGKAHSMSEEVHQAMVSRGYTGQPRTLATLEVRTIDWAWLAGCAVVTVVSIGVDRALAR